MRFLLEKSLGASLVHGLRRGMSVALGWMREQSRQNLLIALCVAIIAGGWIYWDFTAERRNAYQIVEAIENYRQTHGRLPDSSDHEVMKGLGFELLVGWHPDYQIIGKEIYRITILEGFDGPYWIYDSSSKRWRKGF